MSHTVDPQSIDPEIATSAGASSRPRKKRRTMLAAASVWMTIVVIAAVFADLLPIADFGETVGESGESPFESISEPLGTDRLGRSMLSRSVYGARVSLAVGLLGALLALVVGGLAGLLAAQFKGPIRAIVDVLANSVLAVPPIIFLLAIVSALQPSIPTLVVSLSMLVLPTFARLTKANALSQMGREYILAANAMGAGNARILFRELMPNAAGPVLAYSLLVVASLIVAEGALSFLGLGVPPPYPTWGGMIASGQTLLAMQPWPVLIPAFLLFFTVYSLNTVGEALQQKLYARESQM
ncbi:MAG: ABC transporter permease [Acidimicrobiales bacterium]